MPVIRAFPAAQGEPESFLANPGFDSQLTKVFYWPPDVLLFSYLFLQLFNRSTVQRAQRIFALHA